MNLVEEDEDSLAFKCYADEKMGPKFLAVLADLWPALRFEVESWFHAGGLVAHSQKESSSLSRSEPSLN